MNTAVNKKVQVYESLKKRIIDCELLPGLPINEAVFASELGVSKTPIREALRQLERDGLVVNIPGRGSTISHITSSDIREIFEIREILETGAAKQLARFSHDYGELIKKQEEHRQFLDNEESREEYAYEWGEWEDVHLAIMHSLGNRTLLEMYEGLLDRIKRIRNNFGRRFTQRRLHEIVTEHLEILDSILAGDPIRTEDAVRCHLQNAGAFISGLSTSPRNQ